MKTFNQFSVICLFIIALVSCGSKEVFKDENFTIQVSNIKSNEAIIKIIPSDTKAYYYWDIVPEERFNEQYPTLAQDNKDEFEWLIEHQVYEPEYGETQDPPTSIEYFLYKGIWTEKDVDYLRPSTNYVVYAYYTNDDYLADEITTLTFTTGQPKMLDDMKIFFSQGTQMQISANGVEPIFYGYVSTTELGSQSVVNYAQKLFEECCNNSDLMAQHSNNPEVTFTMNIDIPYPNEPTEWFACTFWGTTRTSKWFTCHTDKNPWK